jgi:MtrB/PioB family decaheme-associated outer membrane protein
VTVNSAFGWMKQDDDFLPFTVNEALSVTNPLPRDSLDAEIQTTMVDARIASRPFPKLRMNLTYRYDDRDNETPRDVYVYVQGDSEDQQASMFDGNARINRPYSYTHHKVEFETGYRILKRTEMTVGYRWDQIKRDFQETKRTRENTISARLRSQPWSFLSARLHYERSWRDPASYDGTDPLEISENLSDPDSFDPDTDFENHPLLRKFYLASRERDKLTAMVTVTPLESLSIAFNMNWINDDYNHTEIGLTDQQILSPGVDISFAPTQRVMAHVFYTFEKIKSQQNGWSFLGFVPDWEDPDRRWSGDDEDKVHTVGCGFDLVVLEDQFSIGADYLYVRSRGKTDMTLGSAIASIDPDNPDLAFDKVISKLHTVNVHGDYKLTENLSTRLGYTYANLESNDWAFHGVTPTTINRVIATGQESPDYTEHVVAWSLTYAF